MKKLRGLQPKSLDMKMKDEQRDLVVKEKRKSNHRIISLGYCRETEPEAGVRQETYALCQLFFFFVM